MSRHAPDPLDSELRRAGAVLVTEHGSLVPASFGSVAGEVALTRGGVGMADRADLSVLEIGGDSQAIGAAVERVAGIRPEVGLGWRAADAWWCSLSGGRMLAIADVGAERRLASSLGALVPGGRPPRVRDVSDDYSVITLLGPRAEEMMVAAGIDSSDLPSSASFSECEISGRATIVIHERAGRFLLLASTEYAVEAWVALRNAGREFGVGFIGHEALERLGAAARHAV